MPVKNLIAALDTEVPESVRKTAAGLPYRDFITVGVLVKKLTLPGGTGPTNLVPDNWIYIQEPDVRVGRLQIFNNWSPYMVADPEKRSGWGWSISATRATNSGRCPTKPFPVRRRRAGKIGIIDAIEVLDAPSSACRRPTRPISAPTTASTRSGSSSTASTICSSLGRNGMHRYNNRTTRC